MSCGTNSAPSRRGRRGAFTLLEVLLSVAILALITISLYRFVVVDLQAIHFSTEETTQKTLVESLVAVLEQEFGHLQPREAGPPLMGQAHKFNGKESDEITWLAQAGNGLFTEQAEGLWKVTLGLRPQEKSSSSVLGLVRELPDNIDKEKEHWLPLVRDVDALQINYFDPRLNTWLEKWTDQGTPPSLVRIRIWRLNQTLPYEAVIGLPPTRFPAS